MIGNTVPARMTGGAYGLSEVSILKIMYTRFLLLMLLCLPLLWGCKTNENNYRQAYEKAVEAREAADADLDSTIYGRARRDFAMQQLVVGKDTVDVKVQHVKVTPDGGGINESLMRYNVVAGQFKQLFTAKSMRERLFDAGYPASFVVQTSEPYYYVISSSHNDAAAAVEALRRLEADRPVGMKPPVPYILQRAGR